MTLNTSLMHQVADKLEKTSMDQQRLLIGFDGFLDEIIEAVDSRIDTEKYTRLNTIQSFGDRVNSFSKVGGNIELVVKQEKLGGNGPIMANAMLAMGYTTYYAGNIGYPIVHPVFKEMSEKCKRVFSLAEPAHTDAVEFADGKIMFGKTGALKAVNWKNFTNMLGEEYLYELLGKVQFIAANNWSMVTSMNTIWEGLIATLPKITRTEKVKVFCDLADPKKRLPEDIKHALGILTKMNSVADVILGLNKSEALQVASLLGLTVKNEEAEGIQQVAIDIRNALNLTLVVVHPIELAAAASKDTAAFHPGPYTPSPKLSTGAGDNFNAGFCNGILSGFTLEEAIITGEASSGFYVRNAHSPSKEELCKFLREWADGILNS